MLQREFDLAAFVPAVEILADMPPLAHATVTGWQFATLMRARIELVSSRLLAGAMPRFAIVLSALSLCDALAAPSVRADPVLFAKLAALRLGLMRSNANVPALIFDAVAQ